MFFTARVSESYQPMKMTALRFLETSESGNLLMQRRISEERNPLLYLWGKLKRRDLRTSLKEYGRWKTSRSIRNVIFTNLNKICADRMKIAGFCQFYIDLQIVRQSVGVKCCSLYPSFPASQSCARFSHFLLV